MDTLKDQVRTLDQQEWVEFLGWVTGEELRRRDALPAVEAAEAELITELQDAGTLDAPATGDGPQPWKRPTSKFTAYRPGATVTHDGKTWRNERRGMNGQEPGKAFSGWVDVTPAPEPTEPETEVPETETTDTAAQDTPDTPAPEPEQPSEKPEPRVPTWHVGERITQGDPREYDGNVYIAQKRHTTTDTTRPDKNTGHWLKLN